MARHTKTADYLALQFTIFDYVLVKRQRLSWQRVTFNLEKSTENILALCSFTLFLESAFRKSGSRKITLLCSFLVRAKKFSLWAVLFAYAKKCMNSFAFKKLIWKYLVVGRNSNSSSSFFLMITWVHQTKCQVDTSSYKTQVELKWAKMFYVLRPAPSHYSCC